MAIQRGMDLRQRDRAIRRRGIDLLTPRVLRHAEPSRPDTGVRYDALVAGVVNREVWATIINELLDEIPRRNKAALARKIDFRERTIDRWLRMEVDVAESSVRQVADRTDRDQMDLLMRVGYYERGQLPVSVVPPEDAWIVETIQNSTALDDETKRRWIVLELAREARHREERVRGIKEQIDIVGGAPESKD